MKHIKKLIFMFGFAALVVAPAFSLALPDATYAATPVKVDSDSSCERPLLGVIHPWFRGLGVRDADGNCSIASPGQELDGKPLELSGFIWRIALNIIDLALAVVGFIAFFFILYGGFQFLTGGSNPGQIEKARKTILNAVIGLVIALGATAIIDLVFGILR